MIGAHKILGYWFNPTLSLAESLELWFGDDPGTRASLAAHFAAPVLAAASGELAHWETDPRSCLALILLLDRIASLLGHPEASEAAHHETSPRPRKRALVTALKAIAWGCDHRVTPLERAFYYVPLLDAENPEVRRQGRDLFRILLEDCASETEREVIREIPRRIQKEQKRQREGAAEGPDSQQG